MYSDYYNDEVQFDSYEPNQMPFIEHDSEKNNCDNQNQVKQKTFTNGGDTNQQDQSDKLDYKNLPKMIGNNFEKYIEANTKQDPTNKPRIVETKGVKQFMSNRKLNITNKKISKPKQASTKISELRDFCEADGQSQKIFRQFIKKQLFIDLIQSPKIEDPMKYINGISIYYAASKEPKKMISSKIKFSDYKKKMNI